MLEKLPAEAASLSTRQDKSEGDGNTWVTNKAAERMQKNRYEGRGVEEEEAYDCSNLC